MLLYQIEDQLIGLLAHRSPQRRYATLFDVMAAFRRNWGEQAAQIYLEGAAQPLWSLTAFRVAGRKAAVTDPCMGRKPFMGSSAVPTI